MTAGDRGGRLRRWIPGRRRPEWLTVELPPRPDGTEAAPPAAAAARSRRGAELPAARGAERAAARIARRGRNKRRLAWLTARRRRGERNSLVVGLVGLVLAGLFLLAAFNADRLPIIGGGTTYAAAFTEAAGLVPGDEVRVAGVKVGKVTGVGLDRDHVRVRFRVKDAWLGDQTSAAIKIKTLLGRKYLALDPAGDSELAHGGEIPLARTTSPYDVLQAFTGLTQTIDAIDTDQLAKSFQTLATTFAGTPNEVRGSLAGLSALSRTIASRDALLRQLLARTRTVTDVLAARSGDLTALINDANKLLTEVRNRRAVISALLADTSALSIQLSGLVADNRARLGPALTQLHGVLDVLKRNQANLDKSLALLAPFVRVFANTVGNGRWFDTYLQNLVVPGPLTVTPGRSR